MTKRKNMTKLALLFSAALLGGTALTSVANASHFRGGALVPNITNTGLLTVTQTTFWRKGAADFSVPISSNLGALALGSNILDTADSDFDRRVSVYTRQLSAAPGLVTLSSSSCCRVGGIRNRTGGSTSVGWQLDSAIWYDGNNTPATPILFDFAGVQNSVSRPSGYSQSLNATSPDGLTLSYDQALNTNGGGAGVFVQTPGLVINPVTGLMTIPVASTLTLLDNDGGNPGADYFFSGNIMATDGSSVEFDWLFDAINAQQNQPPVVDDFVINALVGDNISHTMTASDSDGTVVGPWTLLSFLGPAPNNAPVFNPGTQLFTWNTSGSPIGQYIANIQTVDDDGATDVGALTINLGRVGPPPQGVPEPATLGLFGIALAGLGWVRRRRRQPSQG